MPVLVALAEGAAPAVAEASAAAEVVALAAAPLLLAEQDVEAVKGLVAVPWAATAADGAAFPGLAVPAEVAGIPQPEEAPAPARAVRRATAARVAARRAASIRDPAAAAAHLT